LKSLGHEVITGVNSVNEIVDKDIDYIFSRMRRFTFQVDGTRLLKNKYIAFLFWNGRRYFPLTRQIVSLQRNLEEYFSPEQRVWRRVIKKCDVFIFFSTSFKEDHSDFSELKRKGKKIVTFCVGDDIRWGNAVNQRNDMLGLQPMNNYHDIRLTSKDLKKRMLYLRIVEKYSDIILSTPLNEGLALRPYNYFKLMTDPSAYPYNDSQRKVPKVIHAASDRNFKGTKYILEAVEKLKRKGVEFEFIFLENIQHKEILKSYADADIVIGQLYGQGLAKQGIEVLSCGTVFLTYLTRDHAMSEEYFNDNPAISITKENTGEILEEIILNYEKRKMLAPKGRPFIEKYHNIKKACNELVSLVEEGEKKGQNQRVPTFFRENFIPERENLDIYNEMLGIVKDCSWYKMYVKPGNREGLIF
jgi:hypothetical protein